MATPLRNDDEQFEDTQEITTADLAQGKRPAAVNAARAPQPATNERGAVQQSSQAKSSQKTDGAPLFPESELNSLRTRWKEVQTAFVDEPRKAVEQADGLVASAMKRLAEVFAEERSGLEQQW